MSQDEIESRTEKFLTDMLRTLRPHVERIVREGKSGQFDVHHNKGDFARATIARFDL